MALSIKESWNNTREKIETFSPNSWFKLNRLLTLIGLLYVLRVPIVLFLLASLLTWGGLVPEGPGATLLRGIYDVAWPPSSAENYPAFKTGLRFFLVTLSTLMFIATLAICSRNFLRCSQRFGIEMPDENRVRNLGIRLLYTIPPLLLSAFIIIGVTVNTSAGMIPAVAGNILGVFAFLGLVAAAGHHFRNKPSDKLPLVTAIITASLSVSSAISFLVLKWTPGAMLSLLLFLTFVLQILHLTFPKNPRDWRWGSSIGYFGPSGKLNAHHLLAAHMLSIFMLVYCGIFFFKSISAHRGLAEYPMVPTLSVLLILGIISCWLLCTITFFLDHYRIPVLLPIVLSAWFTSSFPQSDHFYRIFDSNPSLNGLRLSPSAMLDGEMTRPPAVIVATTGGGIVAAAWSARVLRELQLKTGHQDQFRSSIRLISAVSGGSVGTMYFVNAYSDPTERDVAAGPADDPLRDDPVLAHAQASSLDEIAVELAYQDVVLNLFPFLRGLDYMGGWQIRVLNGRAVFLDRGAALEDALKRGSPKDPLFGGTIGQAKLLDWKVDAIHHFRPAVIFNATVVETGQRMLFSTTDLDPEGKSPNGRVQFHDKFPTLDIPVTTAVRLSATFPFVSPAARAMRSDVFERSDHIVDGGYSDNYGMASLVEWLDNGLDELMKAKKGLPPKVLIIEIRSSPPSDAPPVNQKSAGFAFQTLHPAETLWNVRETGQLSHNELERDLVTKRWKDHGVSICSVVFQPPPSPQPLSWHLTVDDQKALKKAWDGQKPSNIDLVVKHVLGEGYTCP